MSLTICYYLCVSIFTLKWLSLNLHISVRRVFIESIYIYSPQAFTGCVCEVGGGAVVVGSVVEDTDERIPSIQNF